VVAISRDGARQIVDLLGVAPGRIDLIPLATSPRPAGARTPAAQLRATLGLSEGPVVLNVAAKKRHKNQGTLIRALPAVRAVHAGAQLVLAGAPTGYERELRAEVDRLGLDGAVAFCGYVAQEDLEGLYELATCFAFPSLNEGFGLPILEAMERGLPVACSNVSAMPEVAGEAALLFDPHDPEAAAQAIVRLLGDAALRERLTAAGRARTRTFSWRATAEATIDCWERAMASRR
jgi:glycosyltransferase involved in cell wall biosynthesis